MSKFSVHNFRQTLPTRLKIGIMLFIGSFMIFMLRSNFSIIILAMNDNFHWSNSEQQMLLSAYFCGYIGPNLIAGTIAERFGGRIVIFIVFTLSSVVTAMSPFMADSSFQLLFISRLALGVCGVRITKRSQKYDWPISFLIGILLLHVSQSHISMGPSCWEGDVCFKSSRSKAGNGSDVAFDGTHHTSIELAMGILHHCDIFDGSFDHLVQDRCWFARETFSNFPCGTRIHRQLTWADSIKKVWTATDQSNDEIVAILRANISSLQWRLGSFLSADICANVHEPSFEVRFKKCGNRVELSLHCTTDIWLHFWSRWRSPHATRC